MRNYEMPYEGVVLLSGPSGVAEARDLISRYRGRGWELGQVQADQSGATELPAELRMPRPPADAATGRSTVEEMITAVAAGAVQRAQSRAKAYPQLWVFDLGDRATSVFAGATVATQLATIAGASGSQVLVVLVTPSRPVLPERLLDLITPVETIRRCETDDGIAAVEGHYEGAGLSGTLSKVTVDFSWRADEPYAVEVVFMQENGHKVTWCFARSLMRGVGDSRGDGDVRFRRYYKGEVTIVLRAPSGAAGITFDESWMNRFLARTEEVVPAAREWEGVAERLIASLGDEPGQAQGRDPFDAERDW